mmetsp:Transcript_76850/g.248976  ORF Transcript_76850/g.248976 Transcript_76850/m.248976 type:complete len:419 (-) Transcript_76850:119-1375(-)
MISNSTAIGRAGQAQGCSPGLPLPSHAGDLQRPGCRATLVGMVARDARADPRRQVARLVLCCRRLRQASDAALDARTLMTKRAWPFLEQHPSSVTGTSIDLTRAYHAQWRAEGLEGEDRGVLHRPRVDPALNGEERRFRARTALCTWTYRTPAGSCIAIAAAVPAHLAVALQEIDFPGGDSASPAVQLVAGETFFVLFMEEEPDCFRRSSMCVGARGSHDGTLDACQRLTAPTCSGYPICREDSFSRSFPTALALRMASPGDCYGNLVPGHAADGAGTSMGREGNEPRHAADRAETSVVREDNEPRYAAARGRDLCRRRGERAPRMLSQAETLILRETKPMLGGFDACWRPSASTRRSSLILVVDGFPVETEAGAGLFPWPTLTLPRREAVPPRAEAHRLTARLPSSSTEAAPRGLGV